MVDSIASTPLDSQDNSQPSSANHSRPVSIGGIKHTQKPPSKVKFTMSEEDDDEDAVNSKSIPPALRNPWPVPDIRLPPSEDVADLTLTPSANAWTGRKDAAAATAQSRASRLADRLSNPGSRRSSAVATPITHQQGQQQPRKFSTYLKPPSPRRKFRRLSSPLSSNVDDTDIRSADSSPRLLPANDIRMDDIPLVPVGKDKRPYALDDDTTDDETSGSDAPSPLTRENENLMEARRLVRTFTGGSALRSSDWQDQSSGTETPNVDKQLHDLDHVPKPDHFRPSVLGALVSHGLVDWQRKGAPRRQYEEPPSYSVKHPLHAKKGHHSRSHSDTHSPSEFSSGTATPSRKKKWYDDERKTPSRTHSAGSLSQLLLPALASSSIGTPSTSGAIRPEMKRNKSSGSLISQAVDMIKNPSKVPRHFRSRVDIGREEEETAAVDIAQIVASRKYLKKLAKALMQVGAPSHRLEEYMRTSARALRIDGDFLYLPGSMLMNLNDPVLMTSEVTLVKENRGVELGKFKDVFSVYKMVIHQKYTAEQALEQLNDITKAKPRYPVWFRIAAYGVAAISVGPFAFSARPVDFAPAFILGCLLGFLQLVVVPRSEQFRHVFEVFASVMISFVSRGIGSIMHNGQPIFCFSAITQSSIALILPGYIILTAALDLQGNNLISGAVGMVYAIIYSLFLGFGILIGTTIMGLIDSNATDTVTCDIPSWWSASKGHGVNPSWHIIYTKMIWVPLFTACLCVVNQAKPRQMPMMLLIAVVGWQANYWVGLHVQNNIQVANAIGAFAVGVVANFYSRFFHGLAAAAMLPAIFVQVPSGLAASGSLVAGLTSANQITGNTTGISVVNNGTQGFLSAQNATSETSSSDVYGGTIFNVGYGMVQVAIGISVGLYLSALVVYPFGGKRKRSGLFSF